MTRVLRAEMHLFVDGVVREDELDGAAEFIKGLVPPQAIKGLGDAAGTVNGTVEIGGVRLADDGTTVVIELLVDMADDSDSDFDPPADIPLVD